MEAEHIDDLAEGYALGVLEPAERLRVEQHITICSPCKLYVHKVEDTAHMLAFVVTPVAPPVRCKQQLLEKVSREQFLAGPTPRRRVARSTSLWGAVAATLLVLTTGWGFTMQQRVGAMTSEMATAQTQLAVLRQENASMRAQIGQFDTLERMVVNAAAMRSLKGEGAGEQATAKTYMTPGKNEAVLVVDNLPTLPAGKTYQVWVARPDLQQPLTVFNPSDEIVAVTIVPPEPMDTYRWIMVTIEQAGGATQPSSETVLFGDL